jgi:hypothetical protein
MVAVLLVFSGAACGGDDDSADEPEATDDGSPTDDGGDSGGSTDADLVDGFLDEDCQFLLAGAFLNPLGATVSGDDPNFGDTADQLDAIADSAPDEIQDALATLAEGFAEIAEIFEDIDLSDPSSFQDPDVVSKFNELEEIADEDYEAAADEISTWMSENCSGLAGE